MLIKKTFFNEQILLNFNFPPATAVLEVNVKKIPPGTYEFEEIPNPYWFGEESWYILKGTTFGASKNSFGD